MYLAFAPIFSSSWREAGGNWPTAPVTYLRLGFQLTPSQEGASCECDKPAPQETMLNAANHIFIIGPLRRGRVTSQMSALHNLSCMIHEVSRSLGAEWACCAILQHKLITGSMHAIGMSSAGLHADACVHAAHLVRTYVQVITRHLCAKRP